MYPISDLFLHINEESMSLFPAYTLRSEVISALCHLGGKTSELELNHVMYCTCGLSVCLVFCDTNLCCIESSLSHLSLSVSN